MPRVATALFAFALGVAFWAIVGREQQIHAGAASGNILQCASYTPFVGGESPLLPFTVDARRVERDFRLLAGYFSCVRIYSMKGMEDIPAVAQQHGLKVIAGAWISRDEAANEAEIAQLIALANRWPGVITDVLVGNEVLLRQERSAAQLAAYLRRVSAAIAQPVSYGDVWDFWLQNPELADSVDFITIHLLPYWENQPSGIDAALRAVSEAHAEIARNFPGKKILIGETGWPSEGRQRERAVPSRVNQARFVREFVRLADQQGWRYNLIEAFDQPWKRLHEGTVGGYWGMFDSARVDKHILAGAVSNLPEWPRWLLVSLGIWVLLLGVAGGRSPAAIVIAALAADLAAWHVLQSSLAIRSIQELCWNILLFLAGAAVLIAWLRSLSGKPATRAAELALLLLAALVCIESLGLVFDSRYREFPVAVIAMPALGAWYLSIQDPARGRQARMLGVLLLACVPAILWQETLFNTEAMTWALASGVLGCALLRAQVRGVRVPESVSRAKTAAGAPRLTL